MKTIALLCDSIHESSNESWLTTNAAIQLTRICQSRNCRLLVYANSSTAISVLFAASEYHKPAALESRSPSEQAIVLVLPYDLDNTNTSAAESMFFFSGLRQYDEDDELLNVLLYLSRCRSDAKEGVQGIRASFKTIEAALVELRPAIVVKLGMDARLEKAMKIVSSIQMEGRSIKCYADNDQFATFQSIDSVLENQAQGFSWPEFFNSGEKEARMFSDEELGQIRVAEKLARYSLAFELLMDNPS